MISVFLLWLFIFLIFTVTGESVVSVINSVRRDGTQSITFPVDASFFMGFLFISMVSGILSIFLPVNKLVFLVLSAIVTAIIVLNIKIVSETLKNSLKLVKSFRNDEVILFCLLVVFTLMSAVQEITWLDTQSYHAQNIQWIQKYPVVPGLGNLHDRFAFNSMFFVVSALFTFNLKDALVFPVNSLCFLVMMFRILLLLKNELTRGDLRQTVFYSVLLLTSSFILLPLINTPSPDIICATLVVYLFAIIIELKSNKKDINTAHLILISLIICSCTVYKLSSILLSLALLLFADKDIIRRGLVFVSVFLIVFVPFLIRNYFLSGYLIFPFPSIDIFNVDWKIPAANVIETKSVIEAWARIPVLDYAQVLGMKFSQWVVPWFTQLGMNGKILIAGNLLSVFTIIYLFMKKDYFLLKTMIIVLLNLIFWFVEAPDPRFAYGFFFLGMAVNISLLFETVKFKITSKISAVYIILIFSMFLIIAKHRDVGGSLIKDPSLFVVPAAFEKVQTEEFATNFTYRVPSDEKECFNTDIPCVTYKLNNVILRGKDIGSGFRWVDAGIK
jgi:hypothetical protein